MKSNRVDINAAGTTAAATLTTKGYTAEAAAVTAAMALQGQDERVIRNLIAAAGVSVDYQGSDQNLLALFLLAVVALPDAEPAFVYALDDDGTLAAAMSLSALPTNAPAHLVAEFELTAATVNTAHIALPASLAAAAPIEGTTRRGVQVNVAGLPATATDNATAAGAFLAFLVDGEVAGFLELVVYRDPEVEDFLFLVRNGATIYDLGTLAGFDGTASLGLEWDPTTRTVAYTVDGVGDTVPTFTSPVGADALMPGLLLVEAVDGDDTPESSVGETVTLSLIVDAASITEPMTAGTVDIYGEVIGA